MSKLSPKTIDALFRKTLMTSGMVPGSIKRIEMSKDQAHHVINRMVDEGHHPSHEMVKSASYLVPDIHDKILDLPELSHLALRDIHSLPNQHPAVIKKIKHNFPDFAVDNFHNADSPIRYKNVNHRMNKS